MPTRLPCGATARATWRPSKSLRRSASSPACPTPPPASSPAPACRLPTPEPRVAHAPRMAQCKCATDEENHSMPDRTTSTAQQSAPGTEDSFLVELDEMAFGGQAIGRVDGQVIFVPFAVPGEQVRVAVERPKKGYARTR